MDRLLTGGIRAPLRRRADKRFQPKVVLGRYHRESLLSDQTNLGADVTAQVKLSPVFSRPDWIPTNPEQCPDGTVAELENSCLT